MFRKMIILCTLATLLTACSGELPVAAATPSAPEQPAFATPPETELPPTGTTPVMVEPPERKAPQPINSEYLPQRKDGNLTQGSVFIDRSELLIMESYPIQIALVLQGSLPTPCHQLRVIAKPADEQNQVQIDVYSVVDPAMICIQVIESFEVNFGLGSFPSGHYTVWVNGEMVGEFDA